MWLLNTARAELKFFPTPESVPGGYAILSHVWDEHEQSFQDIQALRAQCAADGTNPHDLASDKIREFCILAERDGYEWGWDDTCCIDKTSSTELSEAITSMYHYYALADVCYVYLRDVPTTSLNDLRAPESAFRKSRWHLRGWTLQELIAPPLVILLSQTWEPLGAKVDMADLLEEITRVPVKVLQFDREPADYSVAARMGWAANRMTTRPEDEAYCLMGIFGIFIPPMYGEGRNAFVRLQEEIMRQVDDPTIFAWGETYNQEDWNVIVGTLSNLAWGAPERNHLYARSPSDFHLGRYMECGRVYCYPPDRSLWERLRRVRYPDLREQLTFDVTPYGVVARLPVVRPPLGHHLRFDGCLIAYLLGIKVELPGCDVQNAGLLLEKIHDPSRQLLYAPAHFRRSNSRRLVVGNPFELAARWNSAVEWKTIHIVHRPPATKPQGLHVVSRSIIDPPFHIPRWHIMELQRHPAVVSSSLHGTPNHYPYFPWWLRGVPLLEFHIQRPGSGVGFQINIHLGLCDKADNGSGGHWAFVEDTAARWGRRDREQRPDWQWHVCAEHHIDGWPRHTRVFAFDSDPDFDPESNSDPDPSDQSLQLQVELSFAPYVLALDPTRARKGHIKFDFLPDLNPIKSKL